MIAATSSPAVAAEKNGTFEGTITATFTRDGGEPMHFVITRKGNLLRVENTSNKLDPINIVDLAANELTIVYPHNTTFVHVDLTKKPASPNPNSVGEAVGFPGTSASSHTVQKMSPPGFPSPPPMPSMPPMPNNPMASGMPNMPIPPMPAMMPGVAPELKKTEKTKKIQGFDCTLYTISDRGENFEIWATNDSALFPFRLIERDFVGRRFGPQTLEETWPELLRSKSLFPVEAVLKTESRGMERLSFKIDSPSRTGKKIDNAEELFSPPKNYIEVQAPQI